MLNGCSTPLFLRLFYLFPGLSAVRASRRQISGPWCVASETFWAEKCSPTVASLVCIGSTLLCQLRYILTSNDTGASAHEQRAIVGLKQRGDCPARSPIGICGVPHHANMHEQAGKISESGRNAPEVELEEAIMRGPPSRQPRQLYRNRSAHGATRVVPFYLQRKQHQKVPLHGQEW